MNTTMNTISFDTRHPLATLAALGLAAATALGLLAGATSAQHAGLHSAADVGLLSPAGSKAACPPPQTKRPAEPSLNSRGAPLPPCRPRPHLTV